MKKVNIEEKQSAKKNWKNSQVKKEAPVLSVGDKVVEGFDRELIVEVLEENSIEVDQAPTPR